MSNETIKLAPATMTVAAAGKGQMKAAATTREEPTPPDLSKRGEDVQESEEKGKRRNRNLNQKELYQLFRGLEERRGEFDAEKVDRPEAARRLSTMLGFEVTAHHVKSACEATGITWKEKGPVPAASRFKVRLTEMEKEIQGMRKCIGFLCDQLGVKVPDYLTSNS